MGLKSLKIEVKGLVQGVGFRPFIYSLAVKFGVYGEVFNDSSGVKIEIYANEQNLDKFCQAITNELPPLARIDELKIIPSQKKFSEFKIISSKDAKKIAPILPDFAICDECKSEFYDPQNRRFHHPFINCTNCGPRFSIIKSLPYDRQNTTMAKFIMCKECQNEYENPLNRRYHAQPIACNECGTKVSLKSLDNEVKFSDFEAIKECANELKNGKIIAIKGIGGFHLVCNALDETAIQTLRMRKNRPHKPFAVMCKDEIMASVFAKFSQSELKLLNSNIKPIVLVKKNRNLPEILAPNLDKVGIFLAPTSLHLLLFEYTHFPLIATSANISGEPIIKNYDEVCLKLKNIADLVLDNDRDILNPSDDSIAFVCDGKTQWLRTSRGIKPKIIKSKFSQKSCFLAIGSELKNEFAIYKDGLIFSSPYIGDLKNTATFERFLSLVDMFKSVYELEFDFVVADLHPYFLHTKHFEKLGFKVRKVQHHYAHVLSVMFENDLQGEVLGFGFDGTGYGDDASIWGGEVFLADENGYERVAKFDPFLLVGGDNAIKNIYHLTYAILKKYQISAPKWEAKFDKIKLANLDKILSKNIGMKTSSLGRIFDAFACLVLGTKDVSYDAKAAMELESLYDEGLDIAYKFELNDGLINYKNAFLNALNDDSKVAATGFINGIANLILELALHYKRPVVLGGGVFQNKALLSKTISNLEKNSIKYYLPKDEPANDSAIAMGQIYYGLKFLSYNQTQKNRNHNE